MYGGKDGSILLLWKVVANAAPTYMTMKKGNMSDAVSADRKQIVELAESGASISTKMGLPTCSWSYRQERPVIAKAKPAIEVKKTKGISL